jgi:hypothetical protein
LAKLETGGFTKIRACIIQLSLVCCWILHSNSKFVTQIEFAVKKQGRVDEIVTSATTLSTRRRERERGTFLPTVRYVVTLWLGYFTPLPWFSSGWSIVALLSMAQCFLFHGLDRWHSSPIAYIQHPVNIINRFCVDWLASAVVSTQRTNIASILTMVYANNLFCEEDWLTHYLELRRVPKMHCIQGNIFMYHIQI